MAQLTYSGHNELVSLPIHFSWAGLVLQAINQYGAHSLARYWQLPFLNQQKGENDHPSRKIMLPDLAGIKPDHQLDAHLTEVSMFSWRNKKNINTFWLEKAPYQELCVSLVYVYWPAW